jgi:cob(I)alamin adenosyltransferase
MTKGDADSAETVARKVLEFQEKRQIAEAKIKSLEEEIKNVDNELDGFLQSVVACL